MTRRLWALLIVSALAARPEHARAQGNPAVADTASPGDTASAAPEPAFRFSKEAGLGLRALWEESVASKQERVACLGTSTRIG